MVGYQRYQKNQVEGAGPLGLVLLSYEVLYKSLAQARLAIDQQDISGEAHHVGRALEAIIELSSSLNMDDGADIAVNLAHLYAYMAKRLGEGLCSNSTTSVDEVLQLTQSLRSGWQKLEEQQRQSALHTPAIRQIQAQSTSYASPAAAYSVAQAGY